MTHKDDTQDDPTEDDKTTSIWWLVGTALLVIAAWGWSGYLIYTGFDEPGDRGTFGDMFGAVNALFSGLAFSVLIYTMILQRIELKLQREELRSTRAELAGQKEQMEIQNGTMRRQQFEQTFFNLLELLSASVKTLEYRDPETMLTAATGRACFAKHLSGMGFVPESPHKIAFSSSDLQEWVESAANELEKSSYGSLGQYISIVEQVTLFVC